MARAAPSSMKIEYRRPDGGRAKVGSRWCLKPAYRSLTSASPRHHHVLLLSPQTDSFVSGTPRPTRPMGGRLGRRSQAMLRAGRAQRTAVACVIIPGPNRLPTKQIRTFGTMTLDLLQLADWLTELHVTHVATESTGSYWKPVWNLLEHSFELLLVNAQHMKAVPGRKTDVKDCEWIADLLRHGLLRASFVPDRFQRELRELTRYRRSLVEEQTAEVNRLQKTFRGSECEAGVGREQRGREVGPCHDRAAAGRLNGRRAHTATGQGQTALEDSPVGASAGRGGGAPPALAHCAAVSAYRFR
jgi:hypothetical protein